MKTSDLYCPVHKEKLVLRVAKQGKAAGKKFWGCPTWNKTRCNYTRPYSETKGVIKTRLEKLIEKIKNKNGKISLLKITGFVLMIPLYVLYFLIKNVIGILPNRKNLRG